jgi:hypothetical protein
MVFWLLRIGKEFPSEQPKYANVWEGNFLIVIRALIVSRAWRSHFAPRRHWPGSIPVQRPLPLVRECRETLATWRWPKTRAARDPHESMGFLGRARCP